MTLEKCLIAHFKYSQKFHDGGIKSSIFLHDCEFEFALPKLSVIFQTSYLIKRPPNDGVKDISELNKFKNKKGIWLLCLFCGMLSHSFQEGFYVSRKHGNQSLGWVFSYVTECNLSNLEIESADACEHFGWHLVLQCRIIETASRKDVKISIFFSWQYNMHNTLMSSDSTMYTILPVLCLLPGWFAQYCYSFFCW